MEPELKEAYYRNSTVLRVISRYIQQMFSDKIDLIITDPYINCPYIYKDQGFSIVAITEDATFHDIDQNFMLNNRYFSIYTKTWEQIIELSEYENPAVQLLTNFTAPYKKSLSDWLSYIYLHERLQANINDDERINENISKHFLEILRLFDKILASIDFRKSFKLLSLIVTRTEYIIYMLNKRTFPQKQEDINWQIITFPILPDDFKDSYHELIMSYSLDEIKKSALNMIVKIKNLLDELSIPYDMIIKEKPDSTLPIKAPLTSDALNGTSEIISKWQQDMYKALNENNPYLAFMTMAKCQRLYNEMFQKYEMNNIDILSHYNPKDLKQDAQVFDYALKKWQRFYQQVGHKPNVFSNLDEFEQFYTEKIFKNTKRP